MQCLNLLPSARFLSFFFVSIFATDCKPRIQIMATLLARTGRHRQRYVDQFRLVAGCIPYKLEKNVEDQGSNVEDRVLVLMISTPKRDDLVFPKGGWEDDETLDEAACREAIEEAGVKGILDENPLGVWEFRSKSSQNSCTLAGGCRGYMFGLQVTEELDHWPGQASYSRKWVSVFVFTYNRNTRNYHGILFICTFVFIC
ncbi:hypothetical protein OIU77_026808 [Salix suchowensis]|uniref:Nudix hydrolase domain-containing protein n=1 Tax=Salix suchowensis TaxID=1278906 RepID=A0ABQ9BQ31_9ROSI|nr:hypothetical protein OIU77_026808 [Salix suchowensis]